jgi:hypothetical protein
VPCVLKVCSQKIETQRRIAEAGNQQRDDRDGMTTQPLTSAQSKKLKSWDGRHSRLSALVGQPRTNVLKSLRAEVSNNAPAQHQRE